MLQALSLTSNRDFKDGNDDEDDDDVMLVVKDADGTTGVYGLHMLLVEEATFMSCFQWVKEIGVVFVVSGVSATET